MGRKNWLFANTEAGAKAVAVIFSIIETYIKDSGTTEKYVKAAGDVSLIAGDHSSVGIIALLGAAIALFWVRPHRDPRVPGGTAPAPAGAAA